MKYFLAHNGIDIFHYGEIIQEQQVNTAQPNLEFFDDLDSLIERLSFFNIEHESTLIDDEPIKPVDFIEDDILDISSE